MDRPLVSFRHVSKRFPGARALEDVSFDVRRGSCHALCGENGAGKSTLGKLLAGIEQPDAGEILVDGQVVRFEDPRDALAAGIWMICSACFVLEGGGRVVQETRPSCFAA